MSRFVIGPDGSNAEFSHIQTQRIEFEPQYSADTTDYECTRVRISFQAVFSTTEDKDGNPLLPGAIHESATGTMVRLRNDLAQPRQRVRFYVGNELLLDTDPTGKGVDAKNGPRPISLAIDRIGGTMTLIVSYTIEAHIVECCQTDGCADPAALVPEGFDKTCPSYVSHRWTETADIDELFYTTKVRTGTIVSRSDVRINPDALRGLVIMPIEKGMKRINSRYTVSTDGLKLQYEYRDKEVYRQPPAPATKAEGHFTVSTPDGGKRICECRVKLTGPRQVEAKKSALLQTALDIVSTKLRNAGASAAPGNAQRYRVIGAVREELWENTVEVHFTGLVNPGTQKSDDFALDPTVFDKEVPGCTDGTVALDPGTRGTQNLTLAARCLKDPCLTQLVEVAAAAAQVSTTDSPSPATQALSVDTVQPGDVVAATVYEGTLAADATDAQYSQAEDGIFTDYQVFSRYEEDPGVYELPAASDAGDALTAFVQVASRSIRLIVDWSAEKIGAKPNAPTLSDNPNAVLLRKTTQPEDIEVSGNGKALTYRIKGQLIYGFKDPNAVVMNFGQPPWVQDQSPDLLTYDSGSDDLDVI
jgi:hypothetical protein